MPARIGVVTFPGSLDDVTRCARCGSAATKRSRSGTATTTSQGVDAVILPGGFSYGDYLRCGAISRFAPVMAEVVEAAQAGNAGARHLQRLPDPLRVPPAARRADPQRPPQVRLPRPAAAGREQPTRAWTRRTPAGDEITIVLKNGEGGLRRRRRRRSTGSRARAGSSSATSTATPTARCATSPASPTSAATWSA